MPRISVVVTLFNKARFIERTLSSALVPSAHGTEILVVDDGSTDGSYDLVAAMAAKYPEILLSRNPGKGTVSGTNFAIERARGEYIFILDGDDVCLPWRYDLSAALLDAFPQVALVTGKPVASFPDEIDKVWDEVLAEQRTYPALSTRRQTAANYFEDNRLSHSQCAIRKSAWQRAGGYRDTYPTCLDYDFYTRTLDSGEHWVLNVPLSINVIDPHSTYDRVKPQSYVSDFRACQKQALRAGPVPSASRFIGEIRYARRYLFSLLARPRS